METITIDDFQKVDIRVGQIISVDEFPEAKKPAYTLIINFGPLIGTKKSSVQITHNYKKDDLLHTLVLCVVNLPPRRIGPFESEVLTLGIPAQDNTVVLVRPDKNVPLGGKLF